MQPYLLKRNGTVMAILLLLAGTGYPASAQYYSYNGLELYNPQMENISFTGTEDLLQVDLLGYKYSFYNGLYAGGMGNIGAINSTAGLYYSRMRMDESTSSNNIRGIYAYHHNFSEDLVLNGALSYSFGYVHVPDEDIQDEYSFRSIRGGSGGLGLSLFYKKARLGFSAQVPLYSKIEIPDGSGGFEMESREAGKPSFNLRASYGFGKKEGFHMEPVFSLTYSANGWVQDLRGYLGARMMFRNWWGLGFTMGNMISLSTSLNILDRVELILGLYSGEHDVFGPMNSRGYLIGNNDFEIIGQIRVKL